jgi:hypothetical protein
MDDRNILRAWEKFTQNGTPPSAVRGIVAASWKRSQGHQIPVERSETRLAAEAELVQRRTENSELIEAAQPALEQARILLADARSMVMLTDPIWSRYRDGARCTNFRYRSDDTPRAGRTLGGGRYRDERDRHRHCGVATGPNPRRRAFLQ